MLEKNAKKKAEFFDKFRALLEEYNVVLMADFELENDGPIIEFHGQEKTPGDLWMFAEAPYFDSNSENPKEYE